MGTERMSDLLTMEPRDLGRASIERPLEPLIQELRDLPWPEPSQPVKSPASPFTVSSGALRITDPSMPSTIVDGDACTLAGVKNGKWYACVQSEHYEPSLEASKMWHHKRIDRVLEVQASNKDYAMLRCLMATYICEVVNSYKSALHASGHVRYLHIQHTSFKQPLLDSLESFEKLEFSGDIERGMAGFFDLNWFMSKHPTPAKGPFSLAWFENVSAEDAYSVETVWKEFYDQMCKLTPEQTKFGTCDHAAVAYAGNVGYQCYVIRDEAGEVVCARIVFG